VWIQDLCPCLDSSLVIWISIFVFQACLLAWLGRLFCWCPHRDWIPDCLHVLPLNLVHSLIRWEEEIRKLLLFIFPRCCHSTWFLPIWFDCYSVHPLQLANDSSVSIPLGRRLKGGASLNLCFRQMICYRKFRCSTARCCIAVDSSHSPTAWKDSSLLQAFQLSLLHLINCMRKKEAARKWGPFIKLSLASASIPPHVPMKPVSYSKQGMWFCVGTLW